MHPGISLTEKMKLKKKNPVSKRDDIEKKKIVKDKVIHLLYHHFINQLTIFTDKYVSYL